VLHVRIKRSAQLSTNRHLVAYDLRLEKPTGACRIKRPWNPRLKRPWWTRMYKSPLQTVYLPCSENF